MTTKDQAIAPEQMTDEQLWAMQHRYEGSVIFARSVIAARDAQWIAQPPAPDCRTCAWQNPCKLGLDSIPDCTNGDQYQPAPAVVLWRTECSAHPA